MNNTAAKRANDDLRRREWTCATREREREREKESEREREIVSVSVREGEIVSVSVCERERPAAEGVDVRNRSVKGLCRAPLPRCVPERHERPHNLNGV